MTDKDDDEGSRPSENASERPETAQSPIVEEIGGIVGKMLNPSRVEVVLCWGGLRIGGNLELGAALPDPDSVLVEGRRFVADDVVDDDEEDHNPDGFVHASPEVALGIADAVAPMIFRSLPPELEHCRAWEGPFRVHKVVHEICHDGPDAAFVLDNDGTTFCAVLLGNSIGGDESAAKARATRIAEALNRSRHYYERIL